MRSSLAFFAGFAAGWVTRSALGTSHSAAVQIVAFALDAAARVRRAVAIELERVDDVVAEAEVVARRGRRRPRRRTHEAIEQEQEA